jgi:acylpyruvate hydrolase
MRLATIRVHGATAAVRIDGDTATECGAPDVGHLLQSDDWRQRAQHAAGPSHPVADLDYAPVVPKPGKIICVGLNYRSHIAEMRREMPRHPTLFAKFSEALIGPYDPLPLPAESTAPDWEAELAVVIGRPVRRADEQTAREAIAGYTIMNDVTMRDWQFRTNEWLQGKTFEGTTPLGPVLVTSDELDPSAEISCLVDGETVQKSTIADLVFSPVDLVSYISVMITLHPGDVIATGTTGGVGHARVPPRYLQAGQTLVTRVQGIGELVNPVRGSAAETSHVP